MTFLRRFPILLAFSATLLLTLQAPAQISVLPTQGKSLGSASAPEPGKWILFTAGFLPVRPILLDGGKTVQWEGEAGDYAVIYFPPGDAQPVVQRVTLGAAKPGPQPDPDPGARWQVVIFVESGDLDSMPLAQLEITSSLTFRKTLEASGHKLLGVWDKDRPTTTVCDGTVCRQVSAGGKYDAFWAAISGDPLPRVAIAPIGGGAVQDFPLPASAAELLQLLQEARP
ncbi:MAG: hypothetical protein GXY58_19495 [Planctomycetaceae bacterium]|nr:hypothetical protein [Planctomycetaceae bacterium]